MRKVLLALVMACVVAPSFADDVVASSSKNNSFLTGFQLGAGVSASSGLNAFVGYNNKSFDSFWWKRLGLRLDFGGTSMIKSKLNSQINKELGQDGREIGDYLRVKDVDLKANHFGAMIDFYPFGDTWFFGGWRLSGGYYAGKLNINAALTGKVDSLPDSEFAFELDGIKYKYSGNTMNGRANVDWKYSGPYVGTGFDIGLFAGLKIYMDAGVVFTNKTAQLGLDVPTDNLQQWDGTTWTTVNVAELETAKANALADGQKELDKIKYYPMVKLGFMYRF